MIFDCHIHTSISHDSEMQLDAAMQAAESLGLGMIFTEHIDYDFPGGDYLFSPEEYFKTYEKYRSDRLLLGVELGMHEEGLERNLAFSKTGPFDFVLGSLHVLQGKDLYDQASYQGYTKESLYTEYFEIMALCLRQHDFIDALGHIDYISRYAPFKEPEVYYHEFVGPMEQVFKTAVDMGTVLEINTRRFTNRSAVKALVPVYKAYAACGGKYVTIGSDAHTAPAIGGSFAQAVELAEACDLKPVYFKNRKMEYMK